MKTRRRRYSRLGAVYFLVLTGLLVGGSLWLDQRSAEGVAAVSGKLEQVIVRDVPQGGWYRWYRVDVDFSTRNGGIATATVGVSQDRFDALRRGDSLRIRYFPAFPLLARAAERSTAVAVRDAGVRLMTDPFLGPFLLCLGGGALVLWAAARVSTIAIFGGGVAWMAVALPMLCPGPKAIHVGTMNAMAHVDAIRLVTKSPARRGTRRHRTGRSLGDRVRRLAVPYQVVQVRFTVPGRSDTLLAVDAVDSASVPDLAVGALVPVRYDPGSPREARLSIGARTFLERNRYHYLGPILGLSGIGMLGAWGWRSRRR